VFSFGGRGEETEVVSVVRMGCRLGFTSLSTLWLATALVVVITEILVGISRRTIGGVKLLMLLYHTSDFNTDDSGGVGEWLLMVGLMNGHLKEVWSTVEVVMVIMTSDGTPTGKACSHSTGK